MEVEIKNNKKLKAKSGDIVVLENYFTNKKEHYVIIHDKDFYYLVNIENGKVICDSNISAINDFINSRKGKLCFGSKAKLILGGKNA